LPTALLLFISNSWSSLDNFLVNSAKLLNPAAKTRSVSAIQISEPIGVLIEAVESTAKG
jgi:hypothetical protein